MSLIEEVASSALSLVDIRPSADVFAPMHRTESGVLKRRARVAPKYSQRCIESIAPVSAPPPRAGERSLFTKRAYCSNHQQDDAHAEEAGHTVIPWFGIQTRSFEECYEPTVGANEAVVDLGSIHDDHASDELRR